ncbi:unnamed protein product [Owenia fusiformis]|uniref:Uncharacterized protein n=1 Tax=Owenia fusiformis TaxID=6347 RepID=A0A8S4NCS3_OWEFU|nr:unnamed protein product [Owenia fusiformis]
MITQKKQYVHLHLVTAVLGLFACSVSNVEASYTCLKVKGPKESNWTMIGTRCFLDVQTSGIKYLKAESDCKTRGGHLASVHSDIEQAFMAEKMKDNKLGYYIGLNDIDKEGSFVWTDGSPYSYQKWAPKPRNVNGRPKSSDCAQVTGTGFNTTEWRTVHCNTRTDGYICSKEAASSCNSTADCHTFATCKTDRYSGATGCQCDKGYTGNGSHCQDVDECAVSYANDCHRVFGICINTNGSFDCMCASGYTGNGRRMCRDINECTKRNSCHEFSKCKNLRGSYKCSCIKGFTGNGWNCSDIDECLDNSNNCHQLANCTNIPGSYMCSCPTGYKGNGVSCEATTQTTTTTTTESTMTDSNTTDASTKANDAISTTDASTTVTDATTTEATTTVTGATTTEATTTVTDATTTEAPPKVTDASNTEATTTMTDATTTEGPPKVTDATTTEAPPKVTDASTTEAPTTVTDATTTEATTTVTDATTTKATTTATDATTNEATTTVTDATTTEATTTVTDATTTEATTTVTDATTTDATTTAIDATTTEATTTVTDAVTTEATTTVTDATTTEATTTVTGATTNEATTTVTDATTTEATKTATDATTSEATTTVTDAITTEATTTVTYATTTEATTSVTDATTTEATTTVTDATTTEATTIVTDATITEATTTTVDATTTEARTTVTDATTTDATTSVTDTTTTEATTTVTDATTTDATTSVTDTTTTEATTTVTDATTTEATTSVTDATTAQATTSVTDTTTTEATTTVTDVTTTEATTTVTDATTTEATATVTDATTTEATTTVTDITTTDVKTTVPTTPTVPKSTNSTSEPTTTAKSGARSGFHGPPSTTVTSPTITSTASFQIQKKPEWTRYSPWSRCGSNKTAICSPQYRFRARMCIFSNGSVVSEDLCDGGEDAAYEKECCKGEACRIMCGLNMNKTGIRNWAVGIERSNPLPERFCHGILLHNYWVLTAGHCVCGIKQECCSRETKSSSSPWRVDIRKCNYRRWKIRALDPNPDNDLYMGLRNFQDSIHPNKIIVHGKYTMVDNVVTHDIALIRLKSPVRMGAGNDDPRPALLPGVICSDSTKEENTCSTHWTDSLMQDCFATIGGKTFARRGVTRLKIFEDTFHEQSQEDIKEIGVKLERTGQHSQSPGLGDSGGPLSCKVADNSTQEVVLGVLSSTSMEGCRSRDACTTQVMSIPHYMQWIMGRVKDWAEWGAWSSCSADCKNIGCGSQCSEGKRQRIRGCIKPINFVEIDARYGRFKDKCSFGTDKEICTMNHECANSTWGKWSEWSKCKTNKFDRTVRFRERHCKMEDGKIDPSIENCKPQNNGITSRETQPCATKPKGDVGQPRGVTDKPQFDHFKETCKNASQNRVWLAALYEKGRLMCAGTLINKNWMLAPAECFSSYGTDSPMTCINIDDWRVKFAKPMSSPGDDTPSWKLSMIILDPKFEVLDLEKRLFKNNKAMLKLETSFEETDAICVRTFNHSYPKLKATQPVFGSIY